MWRIIFIALILFFESFLAQNLEGQADSIMTKYDIPEMAFAVVTKDTILVQKVRGHHRITEKKGRPNASFEDLFHLGSNTKAITGFISAYLVEQGKIKWKTKFFDLFPKLKKSSNVKYHSITLEDLLCHRANVQPFTSGEEYSKLPKFKGTKQQKRTKFGEYVLRLSPIENKNTYNYSNAGYSIAAMMLEKVSGKSWEQLIEEVLKTKLEIDFRLGWPSRNAKNQPLGHWLEGGKQVEVLPNINYDLNLAEPAGDLSMNIHNYSKFIQLNIKGLSGERNILTPETYQYLHTSKKDYSIGWGNYQDKIQEISDHSGSDGTFFSYAQIDRKKHLGYIILVNSGTAEAQKGVFEMLDLLKRKYK
ncbi:serine hydrolase [Riemerella anatipestifer]|nr:serine hydrolase [Riemerella anatipestifer]